MDFYKSARTEKHAAFNDRTGNRRYKEWPDGYSGG
jgi:hypothetical protein